MRVHMDGARIANATAALGGDVAALRAFTVDAGVDVMTFGGTKNGLLGGEAVVFLDPSSPRRADYVRKQVTQLPSKMRFVAAQFNALLDDDLWLELAGHANAHGRRAAPRDVGLAGVDARRPAGRQQRVPVAARPRIEPLRDVVLLLGLGRDPPPGALDDGLGHDRRRRRRASPPA